MLTRSYISIAKRYLEQGPWLYAYLLDRLSKLFQRELESKVHLIFIIANHFEPSWSESGHLPIDTQLRRLERWNHQARTIGKRVVDSDGAPFRHTNFYPAEQYDKRLLDMLADLQREGFCEVEVHLHHGVDEADTPHGLRRALVEFRDRLAHIHNCLSVRPGVEIPQYAFVHGNLALGNSAGGRYCGVDNEFEILRETGCYADFTLPSAPDISQAPVVNRIYQCGYPLSQRRPHWKARPVLPGDVFEKSPLVFTGPLMLKWKRRESGVPFPAIEDGALTAAQGLNGRRLELWKDARVCADRRKDWIFIKLYCHGFFDLDQPFCIGDEAARFFSHIVEEGDRTGQFAVHFTVAREAFNIFAAATDGLEGNPNEFRDYLLLPISRKKKTADLKTPAS